jgi:hypothetical protein
MSVFVLDKRKQPLMPCSEKRARLLLARGRAVVVHVYPFTIRLKDRIGGSSRVSNLTMARHDRNQEKGRQPLRDAAAVNATRWALYRTPASRWKSAPAAERNSTATPWAFPRPMPWMRPVSVGLS